MEAVVAMFARKLVERLEASGTRLHAWLMPTLSRWILAQHHPVHRSLNLLSLTYFSVRYLRTMRDMAVQDALHSPDPMIRRLKRYQVTAFDFLIIFLDTVAIVNDISILYLLQREVDVTCDVSVAITIVFDVVEVCSVDNAFLMVESR
ncbi:hypothetical protein RHGRI_006986 [Rhododendron griersonianum]|uniref:Uncharacterized protein n=1 Tax=Rhododendron griersonianum TaxID=479676 RepID=A0AAV6KWT1_9ERIC|nr:hypothetical protein RHGRI_006986 [Rhododendron griersonianum]